MKRLYFLLIVFMLSVSAVGAQNKATNNVLAAYFDIKNDLVVDDAESAKPHAFALATAAKTVVTDKMTPEQQTAWKKIQLSATRIGEAKDIDTQRDYFAVLSDNMILVIKTLKVNTAPVYQQYCPMKKVNWLSEIAAIKNPFYGKQMPTCGQVTETFAVVK